MEEEKISLYLSSRTSGDPSCFEEETNITISAEGGGIDEKGYVSKEQAKELLKYKGDKFMSAVYREVFKRYDLRDGPGFPKGPYYDIQNNVRDTLEKFVEENGTK